MHGLQQDDSKRFCAFARRQAEKVAPFQQRVFQRLVHSAQQMHACGLLSLRSMAFDQRLQLVAQLAITRNEQFDPRQFAHGVNQGLKAFVICQAAYR
ncbi:hypothetical protein ASF94_01995 [Acidovorax sp. Leaf160]|nr:hypothetical protein ASF94_01995 [Acidovorax sp. Leaf160]